jgi:hypothetical protein
MGTTDYRGVVGGEEALKAAIQTMPKWATLL